MAMLKPRLARQHGERNRRSKQHAGKILQEALAKRRAGINGAIRPDCSLIKLTNWLI